MIHARRRHGRTAEVGMAELQAEVHALCGDLGLEEETARGWMLGFSDLVLTALPGAHPHTALELRPMHGPRAVGIEMTLAAPAGAELTRESLGWWVDECEVSHDGAHLRLVARKWAPRPEA